MREKKKIKMTYAHKNLKVTFGGRIYGDQDIWNCGLTVGAENFDFKWSTIDPSDMGTGTIATAIKSWFARQDTGIGPDAKLEWVKFAIIGTDGKYATGGDGYEYNETLDFAGISGGGSPYGSLPVAPQLTVALTMETNVRRGAGRFGRIYPPLTGNPSSIGLDSFPVAKAQSFKTLISEINEEFSTIFDLNEYGVIVASNVGEGKNARVTSVKVGQVIDTQRRRRNNIPENYHRETLG